MQAQSTVRSYTRTPPPILSRDPLSLLIPLRHVRHLKSYHFKIGQPIPSLVDMPTVY